jgi:signal-transduction protein with cAMP-binding, CBS, and nucleotidyltransferase domain
MIVISSADGQEYKVEIESVQANDYKSITKSRYFFDWKEEQPQEVYKLNIVGSSDILGLVSVEQIPEEWRIHIRLITVSKENKRSDKEYENIAGNLITFISKIAVREYGELACVSLKPKGAIAQHYIDKYGMNITGMTLSVEIDEILELIKIYDHDQGKK